MLKHAFCIQHCFTQRQEKVHSKMALVAACSHFFAALNFLSTIALASQVTSTFSFLPVVIYLKLGWKNKWKPLL